ncbi:uncharacterized protein [Amphiura filiformis]|uniref:uncharacterized protein n=1 Tax=Amphiura filiformis TaxID=82378 RepID=UPI003B218A3F
MDGRVASPSDITLSFGKLSSLTEIKNAVESAPALSNLQLFQCACVNDDSISELVSVINPHLKGFEASNLPSITTAAVRVLSEHCRELQSVKFVSCHRLDRYCLKVLGANCKELRSVSFLKENKDDEWCLQDRELTVLVESISSKLEAASFVGFEDITDDALLNISKYFGKSVIEVDFSASYKITDYGLRILATRCKQLRSLALSNTSITDKGIHHLADNCRHLRKLNVSGCRNITDEGLTQIARKCSKLEYIAASKCDQTSNASLLALIKNCPRLQEFDLRETSITLIDRCLSELEVHNLRTSMCKELPHPPPDIVNGDVDCISNNLKEVNAAYRRRVLILGDAGCGKSSLVKLVCNSTSTHSIDSFSDGIAIHLIQPFKDSEHDKLHGRKLDEDDKSLVLEIWDVSKRRIWQQCQSLFLLQESVCVLVFNLSDQASCQSVPQQLELIQSKSPTSHVIIIGTHEDKLQEPGQHKEVICEEIFQDIRRRQEHRQEELKKELDVLNDIPGTKCPMVSQKIRQVKDIMEKYKTPSEILTISNSISKDLDDIKTSIFGAVLNATHQSNGLNKHTKEAITKCYEKITTLNKENTVVIATDLLYKEETVADEKKSPDGNQKRKRSKQEHRREKQLAYLKTTGAVLEVNHSNKLTSVSSLPKSDDTNSITETESNTSPSKSKEHEPSKASSPVDTKDQSTPISKPSLLCVNPSVLVQAIFAIHVDDTKKAFKFEANKFWPKAEGAMKPNPSILVHALEEVATQGLIRECIFPLLWQNLNLNEAQTRLLIDFLCSLGILVREMLPASGEPDCQCLRLPHYSNLSTQQQYRLPLLGLLMEQGPSLNWTPNPFEGDVEITWRYEFLGSNISPGMITRMLAYCRNQCPAQAVYQHYWNNGVLMKMGQVYIHMSRSLDTPHHINFTGRITTDEEGEHKATELLWIALSHFLLCAQQYLLDWPGLEYKVTLLPSSAYYTSRKSAVDTNLEMPLLLGLQLLSHDQMTLDVVAEEDTKCQVKLNTMLPLRGDPAFTLEEWLTWLSVQPAVWTDQTPSPENQKIDEERADEGGDESSLVASPKAETSSNATQEERPVASPPSKVDKIVAKKEIKWDLGGPRITEEDQIKEAKKVAATFVAAILAGAMAQYISEEIKGPGAEAAAKASAQAAKAAQSGDPEAAAKAVIAAALAVTNGPNNGNNGASKITRSRMCSIV